MKPAVVAKRRIVHAYSNFVRMGGSTSRMHLTDFFFFSKRRIHESEDSQKHTFCTGAFFIMQLASLYSARTQYAHTFDCPARVTRSQTDVASLRQE